MNKILLGVAIVFILCASAFAFYPAVFGSLTHTKANVTLTVTGYKNIRFRTTSLIAYYFGTGTAYPIAATTNEEIQIPKSATTMTFSGPSTATKTINYILE